MNQEKIKMISKRYSALLNDSRSKFHFKKLQTTQFDYSKVDTNQIRRIIENQKKINENQGGKWERFQEETRRLKYTTHHQYNEIDKLIPIVVIVVLFIIALLIAPNQFCSTTDAKL